ncbi:hypothetical protein OAQ04_01885 [Flavobacteriaceae bacterium]|nr:hypothetical protein [Flavobacteriaceae bacterium]
MKETATYTEENIRSLDWKEHIRMRPDVDLEVVRVGKPLSDLGKLKMLIKLFFNYLFCQTFLVVPF